MNKSTKILILIILVILPAIFPFGGRDYYLFPYIPSFVNTDTDPGYVAWALLFAFLWVTIIWFVYGYLFGRWFGKSKKGFIICNAPVIINAVSEIIYYNVLGLKSADHPTVAYWIGSHIDKMNPLGHIFGSESIILSITISVLYYIFLFWLGYKTSLSASNRKS